MRGRAVLLESERLLIVLGEDCSDAGHQLREDVGSVNLGVDSEAGVHEDGAHQPVHGERPVHVLISWMFVAGDRRDVLAVLNVHALIVAVRLVLVEYVGGVGEGEHLPIFCW